jgi:hypothetical protein
MSGNIFELIMFWTLVGIFTTLGVAIVVLTAGLCLQQVLTVFWPSAKPSEDPLWVALGLDTTDPKALVLTVLGFSRGSARLLVQSARERAGPLDAIYVADLHKDPGDEIAAWLKSCGLSSDQAVGMVRSLGITLTDLLRNPTLS